MNTSHQGDGAYGSLHPTRHPGERRDPSWRGAQAWIPAFAGMTAGAATSVALVSATEVFQ
ncbi:MAG TPA: hypothetical protein VGE16_16495 [Albitalea sp.]